MLFKISQLMSLDCVTKELLQYKAAASVVLRSKGQELTVPLSCPWSCDLQTGTFRMSRLVFEFTEALPPVFPWLRTPAHSSGPSLP